MRKDVRQIFESGGQMMNKKVMAGAGAAGAAALVAVAPAAAAIIAALAASQDEVRAAEIEGLPSLEQETKKQHLLMEYQSHQARVAQEVAIANRIALSDEVEIEEFYDQSGKLDGELGGSITGKSVKLGAKGANQKVAKRIYKFRGTPGATA